MSAGPKHPDSTLIITGSRGTGKTVLLNTVEREARARNWAVIPVSASEEGGLTHERINGRLRSSPMASPMARARSRLRGLTVATGVHRPLEAAAKHCAPPSRNLADSAAANNAGVLITVDELQAVRDEDAQMFANAIQHVARREQRPVMFCRRWTQRGSKTRSSSDDGITFFSEMPTHNHRPHRRK